jgi:Polyketide cyclase / dehydrase and lipid transport
VPRYCASVTTDRHPDVAFKFMASFENVAEWDPGVVEAAPLGSGELGVGSRFRVVVSCAGRKLPLEYKITEFEPPRRVVLVADTATLRSVDKITVEPAPSGSTVTYDANLELLGLPRIFNPVLALFFRRVGDRAADGLRRQMQP